MSNAAITGRATNDMSGTGSHSPVPLVVDLDGTLLHGSLLLESVVKLMKRPSALLSLLPIWLTRGRDAFVAEVAKRIEPDCSALAINQPLLNHLKQEHARGRRLFLATDAPQDWANKIADQLGLFEGVVDRNAAQDLINGEIHDAVGARSGAQELSADAGSAAVEGGYGRRAPGIDAYVRAMRMHQWLKNLLIFAPLIAALRFTDLDALINLCVAFIAFSLCASSVYLLNDLADIEDDRRHPTKRNRPFASGELPVAHGLVLIPGLLLASALLALTLPVWFGLVLAIYYAMTLAYTFFLKRIEAVDVVVLALLYTTRVFAGGAAAGIPLSVWLLTFSTFIFLSLAIAKRCAELVLLQKNGRRASDGRGYLVDDLPALYSMGIGSSYVGALVLALYLVSPQVAGAYTHPELLWIFVPAVIFWATRLWLKTWRGNMHDDPLVFTARDPTSLTLAATCGVVIWLAM